MMNLKLDNTTVTLNNGETVTLQQYTKTTSEYLIKKLESFDDMYSKTMKKVLVNNLGKKWSEVRAAIDKMDCKRDFECEYDLGMEMAICDIVYPATDQDEELSKNVSF